MNENTQMSLPFTVKETVKMLNDNVKPIVKCPYPGNCLMCDAHELGEHQMVKPTPGNQMLQYPELGFSIGKLVEEKQAAYGNSFGKAGEVMKILYPEGICPSKLNDALTVIRVLDKLFRIATDRDAMGESPWRDIAGYALLATKRVEEQKKKTVHQQRLDEAVNGHER